MNPSDANQTGGDPKENAGLSGGGGGLVGVASDDQYDAPSAPDPSIQETTQPQDPVMR